MIDLVLEWIRSNDTLLWILGSASVVMFVGSLILTPAILIRIPEDYFSNPMRPESTWAHRHPIERLLVLAARNIFAAIFIIAGIAMLILPGQGILTLIVGFLLLDFPGKYGIERWIVHRQSVLRPINWLRRRAGRKPLQM